MAIRIAQVKSVCTSAEVKLVEASRAPALNGLSLEQVRQHAQRARKAFDKWQDTSRAQSRAATSRGQASEDAAKRTALKVQIFREALDKFEARAKKLEASGTAGSAGAGGVQSSGKRSAPHRAARSSVRSALKDAKAETNKSRSAKSGRGSVSKEKATANESTEAKSPSAQTPADAAKAPKPKATTAKKQSTKKTASEGLNVSDTRQQSAKAAAKQARVDRSGLTSRVRGHVSARGKRKQARRDSKQ